MEVETKVYNTNAPHYNSSLRMSKNVFYSHQATDRTVGETDLATLFEFYV